MAKTATAEKLTELSIGDDAPELKLPTDGVGYVNLTDYVGKRKVVVYFYPKDDTPGCTVEAVDFRNKNEDFAKSGTIIIGVSKDSCKSHDKFKEKYGLNFHLGSDETGEVCSVWGTWVEKSMYGKKYMGIQRDTFLIDKNGKIAQIGGLKGKTADRILDAHRPASLVLLALSELDAELL